MLGSSLVLRLQLSRAKHRSLAGHPRTARFIASLVPGYAFDDDRVFRSDDCPDEVEATRRAAFARLSAHWRSRFANSLAMTEQAKESLSDLQLTSAYRVPFQYSAYVR